MGRSLRVTTSWERPMRTFIAVEFSPNVAQQLETTTLALQHYLREQNAPSCFRWVATPNIHLTLRFLGETTPDQVQRLATGLREVANAQPPFPLTIGDIGGFPNLRRPRVLWLGVGGDLPQLNALQAAVERTARMVGFPAEQRAFSAHLTLARAQRTASQLQLQVVGSYLSAVAATTHMRLRVVEIVHIRSELNVDGAVYTPFRQFPLRGSSASVV